MVRRDGGFFQLLTQDDVDKQVVRIRSLSHDWYSPDDDCIVKAVNPTGTRAMVGRQSKGPEAYSMHYRNLRLARP